MLDFLAEKRKVIGGALLAILIIGGVYYLFRDKDLSSDVEDLRFRQIELYSRLLETDPRDADLLVKIGSLYKSIGDNDKAIGYYRKALESNPDNYAALNELGHAYALKGDYKNAIETFEKAKQLKPKQPGAYNRLGNVFSDQRI